MNPLPLLAIFFLAEPPNAVFVRCAAAASGFHVDACLEAPSSDGPRTFCGIRHNVTGKVHGLLTATWRNARQAELTLAVPGVKTITWGAVTRTDAAHGIVKVAGKPAQSCTIGLDSGRAVVVLRDARLGDGK